MSTKQIFSLLKKYESRNVTLIEEDGFWPIVWESAQGVHVRDAEGRRYLDLTGAFGVAAAGHANPRVVRAGQKQMSRLLHAMGDVHPHELKGRLARELSRISYERWTGSGTTGKSIFCNSGFEAVEAALKTCRLATGKPGVVAFTGAYHGLGYGALNATHREHFRSHFANQLGGFGVFVDFPVLEADLPIVQRQVTAAFKSHEIGAILVEPIQVRGGINIPPRRFLPLLRRLCDQHKALLVLDEIYTGFGRTGKWFGCEHSDVVPDVICLGKALTGGFPLSVCVGRADLMDAAWPPASGEAIHTSTFLGHPVGCAMALAQIQEIRSRKLVARSERMGKQLLITLKQLVPKVSRLHLSARGMGLLAGLELRRINHDPATEEALTAIKRMLAAGYILLPEGEHGNIISFTPPLTITPAQLRASVEALAKVLRG